MTACLKVVFSSRLATGRRTMALKSGSWRGAGPPPSMAWTSLGNTLLQGEGTNSSRYWHYWPGGKFHSRNNICFMCTTTHPQLFFLLLLIFFNLNVTKPASLNLLKRSLGASDFVDKSDKPDCSDVESSCAPPPPPGVAI